MENGSGQWRTAFGQEAREKMVERITDTLHKHMPHCGPDGMSELLKIAWRFEEKIFMMAADEQDYLRRISMKMLNLESKSQGGLSTVNANQSNPPSSLPPSDHHELDHHELVWSKLQLLRNKYFEDMNELLKMLISRSQATMPADQLQKLNRYREVLSRMIPYISATKNSLPKEFTLDKVEALEKQIVSIIETFKSPSSSLSSIRPRL